MARKNNDDTTKKFAIGAALAAGIGYIAGILTAPQSGRETRQDIKDTTAQAITETEKQLKGLHTQINDLVDEAKSTSSDLSDKARKELDGLLDRANDSRQKAREMISGIHEGDADDKELQKAIKEAQKAVDHLRKYLKK